MSEKLRLMCVLAHPDDESLGSGGTLAKYAAEGVETYLVTATRGERGWWGDDYPGLEALGKIREAELQAAAKALSLREVSFLNYVDGDVDQADPAEAVSKIVEHLRRRRPQVVITFSPDGAYGHPDHIATSQFATAAIVCAADPGYGPPDSGRPHRVSKLYYKVWTLEELAAYQSVFGDLVMRVDDKDRRVVAWEDWAITTRIDTEAHWRTAWQAVLCHQSQLPAYHKLENLSEEHHKGLWGCQGYYRAFSVVNGGRQVESDLFEGLR
ncbi:MAG: PIG-L family deacetylase [Chloroflexi bacterium]|nr:PIG-L family deacetylase [Chloroflexota bacterium]